MNLISLIAIGLLIELLSVVAPIPKPGMMTGDGGHHCIQPRLSRAALRAEVDKHGSVDRVLAASPAGSQHLLKAVSVFAEVVEQAGDTGKIGEIAVKWTGRRR
jgi:hypothetical protein